MFCNNIVIFVLYLINDSLGDKLYFKIQYLMISIKKTLILEMLQFLESFSIFI